MPFLLTCVPAVAYVVLALQGGAQVPPPPPEAAAVVTLIAALCPEVPNASLAATVKLKVVDATKPVTEKPVPVAVPIELPFRKTV